MLNDNVIGNSFKTILENFNTFTYSVVYDHKDGSYFNNCHLYAFIVNYK